MNGAEKVSIDSFQYTAGDIKELLEQSDPEAIRTLFAQFSRRYIHVGQLGVERNTFIGWEKAGLIPYEREESGWRKFSFLEAVWVKTVQEMRALGISTEVIKEIKEMLWPKDAGVLRGYLTAQLREAPISEEQKVGILASIEESGDRGLKQMVEEEQFCLLLFFVAGAVINKTDYCLLINRDRSVALFPLLSRRQGTEAGREQLNQILLSSSYTLVNLWSIIQELALGEAVQLDQDLLVQFVSPQEQQILELVREKQYSEILVEKTREGELSHIKVTKRGITEEVIKKLHAYLKKGSFQNVAFKTKDGLLIQFEETSVIKLDPPRKRGRPRKHPLMK